MERDKENITKKLKKLYEKEVEEKNKRLCEGLIDETQMLDEVQFMNIKRCIYLTFPFVEKEYCKSFNDGCGKLKNGKCQRDKERVKKKWINFIKDLIESSDHPTKLKEKTIGEGEIFT